MSKIIRLQKYDTTVPYGHDARASFVFRECYHVLSIVVAMYSEGAIGVWIFSL